MGPAKEVVAMRRKSLVAAVAGFLLLGIAGASWIVGRAGQVPDGSFRVAVQEVIRDDDLLVTQVEIETRPTAYVHLSDGRSPGGGMSARMPEAVPPARPWWLKKWPLSLIDPGARAPSRTPSRMKLTILGDRVGHGPHDLLKFRVQAKTDGGSTMFSSVGPQPAGKRLPDSLSVLIAPGIHREGQAIPAIRFENRIYHLTVDAPKS